MSAWIVARAHIDVLVLAGVQFGIPYDACGDASTPIGPAVLAAAGVDLWAENHLSVNCRYGEDSQPPPYPAPTAEVILDPVVVVKAVDCFAYQSCEHAGWDASRAADYCVRLRAAALDGPPLKPGDPAGRSYPVGYDDAPWGIDHLAQAAAGSLHRGGLDEAVAAAAGRGPRGRGPGLAGVPVAALRQAAGDPWLAAAGDHRCRPAGDLVGAGAVQHRHCLWAGWSPRRRPRPQTGSGGEGVLRRGDWR
jgi:hypothetical protein